MSDFEIADDYVKVPPRVSLRSPMIDAVIEGHTVFIPGAQQSSTPSRFKRAVGAGLKVRSRQGERDGVKGVYVWADKP